VARAKAGCGLQSEPVLIPVISLRKLCKERLHCGLRINIVRNVISQ
jgi:hypothetical protein